MCSAYSTFEGPRTRVAELKIMQVLEIAWIG